MEAKASERTHRTDARAVADVLSGRARGVPAVGRRLGVVVTRGREIELLAPGVWAIPDWRLLDPSSHARHRQRSPGVGGPGLAPFWTGRLGLPPLRGVRARPSPNVARPDRILAKKAQWPQYT